jgi:ABC-type amino acid transport substrate-binding protein
MSDDLRNNLWKGHYLGGGVADVMVHVAADPKFAAREDKVDFFGAYFNEAVSVVYHPDRLEDFESPMVLSTKKVGVEIDSISDYYLSGAFNGRLRTAAVRHGSLKEAVEAFRAGELDALMAPRGELQGLMSTMDLGDVQFRQQELVGLFRTSWDIGLAVKQGPDDSLRQALAQALGELRAEGELEKIFARHGVVYVAPSTELAGAE